MFRPTHIARQVLAEISRVTRIQTEVLVSEYRGRQVVRLRQAYMFVAFEKLGLSMPQIARLTGKSDHTTVLHGRRALIAGLKARDPETLRAYRIAIRAYVRVKRQQEEAGREVAALVENLSAAQARARAAQETADLLNL